MKKNENHSHSVYQNLIKQLLTQARLLSIQESILLWVFRGKAHLDKKQRATLRDIAIRENIFTAIKSVESGTLGGDSDVRTF